MKHVLNMELDFITNSSPLEFASEVAPLVREALQAVQAVFGDCELEFDIFLVLDGCEVRLVMEPV